MVAEVREARFFLLLADETTDASTKEQLTTGICLRYMKDESICECFFGFREASDLTGAGLASKLLATLTTVSIPVSYMVGQGYDGAAVMSGCKNGVQKHIRDKYSTAMYVHCISHCLNLCLMKAGQVTGIKKAVTVINEISVFYHDSSKRTRNLQEAVQQKCKESLRISLKQHCAIRWVEKQEAVRVFKQRLPAVCASLDDIALWPGDAKGKALLFSASLLWLLKFSCRFWKSRNPDLCDYKEQLRTFTTRVRAFVTALLHCRECELINDSRKSLKMLSNSMVQTSRCQESTLANKTVETIQLIALKSITDGRCTFHTLMFA